MKLNSKPLLCALLLVGLCGGAQAAYFERVDYVAFGGYSAVTNSSPLSDLVQDLSPAQGDITLFGAQSFNTPLANGSLDHSYAADAFLSFSTGVTGVGMTLSHSLAANASGNLSVGGHQQDAFIDLSAVTLRIAGSGSESAGTAVTVSFAGAASALYDFGLAVANPYLSMGLSVARGNDVVAEYLWDVTATGDEAVSFSFADVVGESLTFSSYMLSGGGLADQSFAQSNFPYTLIDAGASLTGEFTLAAVPEPETFAMLLAGLGLIGAAARRRKLA